MKKYRYKKNSTQKGNGLTSEEKTINDLKIQLDDIKMEQKILLSKLEQNKKIRQKIESQLYTLEQAKSIQKLNPYRGRLPYKLPKKSTRRTSRNDWGKWNDDWSPDEYIEAIREETKDDLEREQKDDIQKK